VVAEFGALPPDTELGYSPVPGARRVLRPNDLARLGARFGLDVTADAEVCFEWPLEPLNPAAVRSAMEEALAMPQAEIEVVEVSNFPVPSGEIRFDTTSLQKPPHGRPDTPLMWRGRIEYGGGREFDIWARVRISMPMTRVLALVPIRAGTQIRPGDVSAEEYRGFPLDQNGVVEEDEVIGYVTRRSVRAGEPVLRHYLDKPIEVARGDLVEVRVRNGAALIKTDGKAQASGRRGEVVTVRNTRSGRDFQATVAGPGTVLLLVSDR
jgi:flagella basal body P-ring formation protein FlgA